MSSLKSELFSTLKQSVDILQNDMINSEKENVIRNLRNFSTSPYWNTTMNRSEVNFLFENHSDTVYCNGNLRQIKADPLTGDIFKVYTVPF